MTGGSKQKTKSSSTTAQTQTAAPPTWTQPGLEQTAGMVTGALGQIPTEHYSGQQIAYMSPQELAAITDSWGATGENAGDLSAWMQGYLPQLMEGGPQFSTSLPTDSYDMGDRQQLEGVINASIDPVMQQLLNTILPGIQSSALASGAYSGDRAMKVLPTQAIDNATESMQRIAAQLGYEDYQNWENRRLSAWQSDQDRLLAGYGADTARGLGTSADELARLGLMPDMVNSILRTQASEGDLLRMAAELGISTEQAQINDALAQDAYASTSPFMGLDQATALLTALSGGWGTQNMTGQTDSKSTTTTKQDPFSQVLQAAMGVGSMALGFPGVSSALGLGGAGGAGAMTTSLPSASSVFAIPPLQPLPNYTYGYGG